MGMKLLIAVPTTDYVHADFVKSLCDLTSELSRKQINYKVEILSGTLVYFARIRLANKAINENFTHVLWLDSDMVFNNQVVDDLMFCGKEMVCGAFVSRRPPYGPCVYSSIKKGEVEKVKEFGTTPFKVDGCGFATVLTSVDLLQAEEEPTFSIYSDESVPIKEIVSVMNIAKRNHYKVILATQPE